MKISKKSVTFQNGWNNYDWAELPNWTPESGTVLAGNGIQVPADKLGATLTARGEWVEAVDHSSPHAVRILRKSDGLVVATSQVTTGQAGVVNATVTANIVAGEVYVMQFYSNSAQPGTVQPPKTGGFLGIGNTPGTYLSIT